MAIFKVAIEKEATFQGKVERWSNVYTLTREGSATDTELEAMADDLVSQERAVHSNQVSYKKARVWDVGSPPNYMRVSKDLNVTGGMTTSSPIYRECAVMISAPLPRRFGVFRSLRRDLRKYLHTCHSHGQDAAGATAPTAAAGSDAQMTTFMGILLTGTTGNFEHCAPNGDQPTGPWVQAPYLEHRQFPRGRKES